MASPEEVSTDVATWRTVLLLLLILIISISWEFINDRIDHGIKKVGHLGLKTAWDRLKFEVLTLGLISLLLVVFEDQLQKICIPEKKSSSPSYYYPPPAAAEEATHRRLLASTENPCPEGKEPLWPSELIHKIHILIFLISINHIFYAFVSFMVCRWSVRHWSRWEAESISKDGSSSTLKPLREEYLQRQGEARWFYKLRASMRQFSHRLDCPTYLALRRMRLEELRLPDTYEFTRDMYEALEDEFGDSIFRTEFFVWAIAIVFVVVPAHTNLDLWLSIAFLGMSLVVGGKLHVIVTKLAQHAYSKYKDQLTPQQALLTRSKALRRSMGPSSHSMAKTSLGIAKAPLAAISKAPLAAISRIGASLKEQIQKASGSLHMAEASESGSSRPRSMRPSLSRHSAPMSFNSRGSSSLADAADRAVAELGDAARAQRPTFDHQTSDFNPNAPPLPPVQEHPTHSANGTQLSASDAAVRGSADLPAATRPVGEGVSSDSASIELWAEHSGDADTITPNHMHIAISCSPDQSNASPCSPAWCIENEGGRGWSMSEDFEAPCSRDLSQDALEGWPVAEHKEGDDGGDSIQIVPSFRVPDTVAPSKNECDVDASVPRRSQESVFDCTEPKQAYACVAAAAAAEVRGDDAARPGCFKRARRLYKGVSQTVVGTDDGEFVAQEVKDGDFEKLFWFSRPSLCLKVFQCSYFKNALSLAIIWFAFWQNEHHMFGGAVVTKGRPALIVVTAVLVIFDMLLLIHGAMFVLPVYVLAKKVAESKEKVMGRAHRRGGVLAEKLRLVLQGQATRLSEKDSMLSPGTLSPMGETDSFSALDKRSLASPAAKSPLALARRSVPELARTSAASPATPTQGAQGLPSLARTSAPSLARRSAPKLTRRSIPDPLLGRILPRNPDRAAHKDEQLDRLLTGMLEKQAMDHAQSSLARNSVGLQDSGETAQTPREEPNKQDHDAEQS